VLYITIKIYKKIKMSRINLHSFEVGYKLAQMLRTIQYEILAKPIISAELLEFERNLKQKNVGPEIIGI